MTPRTSPSRFLPLCCLLALTAAAFGLASPTPTTEAVNWKSDPAWYQGKAEWALYDAQRTIYGQPRSYEATIFTNKQLMNPKIGVKSGSPSAGDFEVFKHNVSEMVPAPNYTYRFLTTCFIRTADLSVFKLVVSTQEDCGATYKQFVNHGDRIKVDQHIYFPNTGQIDEDYRRPGRSENFTFHDALTLRLRDYPFDADTKPVMKLKLVEDQTDTHPTRQRPEEAEVKYVGKETLAVPYGEVPTHHLRVNHAKSGGTTHSDYWFAADPALRHVLVQYEGPWGVKYQLKQLEWWAYWKDPRPEAKNK